MDNFPRPQEIKKEDIENWENWHLNNTAGYIYFGNDVDKDYRMLPARGSLYSVEINCDVQSDEDYATTKKTLRRLSFKLSGSDGECKGSMIVQYGHNNGIAPLSKGCDTEVFDIEDFDSEEMYKLGYALIRLARTNYFGEDSVVEEQKNNDTQQ